MNTSTSGSQQHRAIGGRLVEACLEAAAAAPSVHNTQPWRFLPRPESIEIYADPERLLPVIDPRGRDMAISLGAAFALSRACVPAMKRAGRGCIVNITSGAATKPSLTGIQSYCATKHALLGLTRQLAHELGPHGIRVNSVAPGLMLTNEATKRQWAAYDADRQRALVEGTALQRLGGAQDIVNAVLFLASDLSAYITGQHLQVDGGR